MKKKIMMVCATVMMALGLVIAAPKTEVKADTNYAALGFDEAIAFWSSTPLFDQIYQLEVNKSDYAQVTKDNKLNYFRASLVDSVNRPDSVRNARPLTYSFMSDMLKLSNPNFINIIKGNTGSKSDLRIQIDSEVGYFAANAPAEEKDRIASDLMGKLANEKVTTLGEYNVWKYYHGGRSAFEVYYGGYCWYAAPCAPNGYWWNGYYWWNGIAYTYAVNAYNTQVAVANNVAAVNQTNAQVQANVDAQVQAIDAQVQAVQASVINQQAALHSALGF